ncbi:MAG: hypothetical protein R2708_27735 [Vicinamibacterales bacterium]
MTTLTSTSIEPSPTSRWSACPRRCACRHGAARSASLHRFGRPLGAGDFSDLVEDFFSASTAGPRSASAYRYGPLKATQIAVHRTNDRTIQFMLEREIAGQTEDFPVGQRPCQRRGHQQLQKDSYSPGLGLIVSREFDRAMVYVEPIWPTPTACQRRWSTTTTRSWWASARGCG